MITSSFSTVALLLFSLSFAQVSHHICFCRCSSTSLTLPCPISLNSLDLAGVRLLSPRDSQILPTPVAGADDASADDGVDLMWEFDEDSGRYYVSFPDNQYRSPVGAIGDLAFGVVLFSSGF